MERFASYVCLNNLNKPSHWLWSVPLLKMQKRSCVYSLTYLILCKLKIRFVWWRLMMFDDVDDFRNVFGLRDQLLTWYESTWIVNGVPCFLIYFVNSMCFVNIHHVNVHQTIKPNRSFLNKQPSSIVMSKNVCSFDFIYANSVAIDKCKLWTIKQLRNTRSIWTSWMQHNIAFSVIVKRYLCYIVALTFVMVYINNRKFFWC